MSNDKKAVFFACGLMLMLIAFIGGVWLNNYLAAKEYSMDNFIVSDKLVRKELRTPVFYGKREGYYIPLSPVVRYCEKWESYGPKERIVGWVSLEVWVKEVKNARNTKDN